MAKNAAINKAAVDGVPAAGIDANLEKAKKQGRLWFRIKRSKTSYLMMAPYLILFTFFTIAPVLVSTMIFS